MFVRKDHVLRFVSAVVLVTAIAGDSLAQDAATSTCPGCGGPGSQSAYIPYVGFRFFDSTVPHQGTAFTIVVRNAGTPVPNAVVELRSTNCSDLVLCENPPSTSPLQTVICSDVIRVVANNLGEATFNAMGGGTNKGTGAPDPGPSAPCVEIWANNVHLTTATAVIFDQNGGVLAPSGVSALDFAIVRNDLLYAATSGIYRARSDFSGYFAGCPVGCGVITALDVAHFRQILKDSIVLPVVGSGSGCRSNLPVNYCP